jgi:hypothetical protein
MNKNSLAVNRICYNCGCRLVPNPDKPKKWVHHSTGTNKCNPALLDPERGTTAEPAKIHLDDFITMVMVGNRVYRRDAHFFPDRPNTQDLWDAWSQGCAAVPIEALLAMGEVFIIEKGRQL